MTKDYVQLKAQWELLNAMEDAALAEFRATLIHCGLHASITDEAAMRLAYIRGKKDDLEKEHNLIPNGETES